MDLSERPDRGHLAPPTGPSHQIDLMACSLWQRRRAETAAISSRAQPRCRNTLATIATTSPLHHEAHYRHEADYHEKAVSAPIGHHELYLLFERALQQQSLLDNECPDAVQQRTASTARGCPLCLTKLAS